jgi:two-component system invasion response regulator UvrY
VLLDLTMPGRGGLETLKDLKREHPRLPVLILSVHPEDQFAERVLKAGASGYVTKDSAPDELVKAIRKAVDGGKYVSPSFAEKLAGRLEAHNRAPHETLSDREYLVMTMMANGKTVEEIGDELALSPKTISSYRSRVFRTLGVSRASEVIKYALERGLVE